MVSQEIIQLVVGLVFILGDIFVLVLARVRRSTLSLVNLVSVLGYFFTVSVFVAFQPTDMQFSRFSFFVLFPVSVLCAAGTCIFYSMRLPFSWKRFAIEFGVFTAFTLVFIFACGHPILVDAWSLMRKTPDLRIIAHRGGCAHGPEQSSMLLNYITQLPIQPPFISLNIQQTTDGLLVLAHSPYVHHQTDQLSGKFTYHTMESLQSVKIGAYWAENIAPIKPNAAEKAKYENLSFESVSQNLRLMADWHKNENRTLPTVLLDCEYINSSGISRVAQIIKDFDGQILIYPNVWRQEHADQLIAEIPGIKLVAPSNVKIAGRNLAFKTRSLASLLFNNKQTAYWYVSTIVQQKMLQMTGVSLLESNYVTVNPVGFFWFGSGLIYFVMGTWLAAGVALSFVKVRKDSVTTAFVGEKVDVATGPVTGFNEGGVLEDEPELS